MSARPCASAAVVSKAEASPLPARVLRRTGREHLRGRARVGVERRRHGRARWP
jgi:hypothetical protein